MSAARAECGAAATRPETGTAMHPEHAAAGTPLVLIVDDSRFLALQLARMLESLGVRAHIPANLEELHRLAPEAALVCIELELFHASGFEVTRALAAHCACPLVLLTGTGRNTDLQWGLRAGASAVLQRPVCPASLRATLDTLACGRAPR